METVAIVVLSVGIPVFLFPVAFIWYLNIGGILKAIKNRGVARQFEEALSDLTCSVDADCPLGYMCLGGRCVPEGT
jgi:hypothetical protein